MNCVATACARRIARRIVRKHVNFLLFISFYGYLFVTLQSKIANIMLRSLQKRGKLGVFHPFALCMQHETVKQANFLFYTHINIEKHSFHFYHTKLEMRVIHTIKELREVLDVCRSNGQKIGLVPTMGALHKGHASLVEAAVKENDVVVVSIFVNPTQFNDKNDLKNYPRDLQADCKLLETIGASIVFAPEVEEMYPEPDTRTFGFAPLDTVMEGACRPGHFNGVAQIVSKLFYAVEPDRAYFGEKDFQQLAIIRAMVKQLNIDVEIIGCPIVRESDGLALSSRNMLLTSEERQRALTISRTLFASVEYAATHTLAETKSYVEEAINATEGLQLEYFQIVDGDSLQEVAKWEDSNYLVGCIALFCGKIRLIDNIKYKEVK